MTSGMTSFTLLSANLSIANLNEDILILVEMKCSSVKSWPNNFSSPSKIAEVVVILRKKKTTASHLFFRIRLSHRPTSLLENTADISLTKVWLLWFDRFFSLLLFLLHNYCFSIRTTSERYPAKLLLVSFQESVFPMNST